MLSCRRFYVALDTWTWAQLSLMCDRLLRHELMKQQPVDRVESDGLSSKPNYRTADPPSVARVSGPNDVFHLWLARGLFQIRKYCACFYNLVRHRICLVQKLTYSISNLSQCLQLQQPAACEQTFAFNAVSIMRAGVSVCLKRFPGLPTYCLHDIGPHAHMYAQYTWNGLHGKSRLLQKREYTFLVFNFKISYFYRCLEFGTLFCPRSCRVSQVGVSPGSIVTVSAIYGLPYQQKLYYCTPESKAEAVPGGVLRRSLGNGSKWCVNECMRLHDENNIVVRPLVSNANIRILIDTDSEENAVYRL